MTDAEALRLVALLTSYFRQELSDETAVLWARELRPFEVIDGMEAAQMLGTMGRFMPSIAEFVDGIRECRNDRLEKTTPMLPPSRDYPGRPYTLAEHLATYPEDRERVEAMKRKRGPASLGLNVFYDTLAGIVEGELPK